MMTPVLRANRPALWIAWGVILLSALLCLGLGLTYQQHANTAAVLRTLNVERRLATVMSSLQDAEVGDRGYALTGQGVFLEPYRYTVAHLGSDLAALDTATADSPGLRPLVARLRELAARKMAVAGAIVALRASGRIAGDAALVQNLDTGKAIMDRVRAEVGGIQADAARVLLARQATSDRTFLWTWVISIVGLVLVGLVTVVGLRDNDRRIALVTARRDELADAHANLVSGVKRSEAAESQVRQMHKMEAVGQLTGGIAHDFNNMLAIVIASLDLARRHLKADPDKALVRIDNALDGARRAATLTARLLAFSRQQALAPVTLDPNRLVAGMSDLLHRTIGEQVRVETIMSGGLWRIRADEAQLESTILNLCVNARDAMADGGRLTIETSNAHLDELYVRLNDEVVPGQYVLIAVTDSGAGMTPVVLGRVFEPFFTTKAVGKGTGLGLSQVFGFMKQSGGHVKIYSEPGTGTSVKIYFPRWFGPDEADAMPAAPMHKPAALPAALPAEVVLVVEDDPDVQLISVDALRYLGYSVLQASSAEEAIKVMALNPQVDLLFTDVVMPGVTGRVLAERALALRPDLKVLYTTGYTRNAVVHNGVLDAGVALLPKPFTVDQLAFKVREVLDSAFARERL